MPDTPPVKLITKPPYLYPGFLARLNFAGKI